MQDITDMIKALAEENRLRVIMALRDSDLCACQITELLGLAPSTVSKHMSILRQARLVESWKEGRWVYFRLADGQAAPGVRELLDWAARWLPGTRQIQHDARRLTNVLQTDREELCRKQNQCKK